MARVRSTARVEREGGEAEGSETVPISEAMQRSGLVISEEIRTTETEQTVPISEVAADAKEGNFVGITTASNSSPAGSTLGAESRAGHSTRHAPATVPKLTG